MKKKADCTPEEWEEILRKDRERKAKTRKHVSDLTPEELEKIRKYNREWRRRDRLVHPDRYKISPEKMRKYNKTYKEKHKQELKYRYKQWYDLNRDKCLKKSKNYKENHREEIAKKRKERRENNIEIYREKERLYARKRRKENKQLLKLINKKSLDNTRVKYLDFVDKLTIDEDPIKDENGYLMVRDFHTKEYFYPKRRQLYKRIQCLKGEGRGESHLYKTEKSKLNCSIFGRKKYPSGYKSEKEQETRDPAWRDMVISRADGRCERCGKECDSLIAHHKVPVASCAMMAADIDNGMALCPECHREVHSTDGCRLHELAAEKRKTA